MGFNSGVLFIEKNELIKLLKRRKAIDHTAEQILENVNDEIHMQKIAIMAYSMGIFKILWKTMIKKQLKSVFVDRLQAIDKYQKAIKTMSINGNDLQLSDIEDLTTELKSDLKSDSQISIDHFFQQLKNEKDRHLIPNSEFQSSINEKFKEFVHAMPRPKQVEVLMLLSKCIAHALGKAMTFYQSWFECNPGNLNHQIIPSNLEVERSFGLFKHFESKYPMMKLTNVADLTSSKVNFFILSLLPSKF